MRVSANMMAVFTYLLDASPDSSLMQYFSSARQACESIEVISQSEDSIEGSTVFTCEVPSSP